MADNFEYISHARLIYRDGYRHAYPGEIEEPVIYGVQGALREYYGAKEGPPILSLLYFFFRMNQSVYLLNTLQQEFGNQGLDESADDYKTRNSFLTAGELLSVRYSHAS